MLVPWFFPTMTGLYASRALTGMTFIFFIVSLQSLAASLGGVKNRAANLTTFSLGQAIAGFVGPVLIGFVIDHAGFQSSYLVLGIMAALPVIAVAAFPGIVASPQARKKREPGGNPFTLLRDPPLRRALLTGALVFAAGDLLNWVLARRSENRAVQFTEAHRLVALFFGAMGINEHAKVKVRQV